MTRLMCLSIVLLAGLSGCRTQDPTKWYLTAYENEKFIFHHDHKKYIAECFQSFGPGKKTPDLTPDCTDLIAVPGIGLFHQPRPAKRDSMLAPSPPRRKLIPGSPPLVDFFAHSSTGA
jgi:hypothetical protein